MIRLFFIAAFFFTGCSAKNEKETWKISEISATCRTSFQTKSLFLKLNLCKQETKMQLRLANCLSETWTSWKAQTEACQSETKSTALSASSFFLNEALSEIASQPNVASQQLTEQLNALELWLSSLPSSLDLSEFESSFQKIYTRVTKQSLNVILADSAGQEAEAKQVTNALGLLEAGLAQRDSGIYTDLFLIQGLNDLLTSIEPKLLVILKVRELTCNFGPCENEQSGLRSFLADVSSLGNIWSESSSVLTPTGIYSKAQQILASNRERLQTAIARYRNALPSGIDKSRLYDLDQTLERFRSFEQELNLPKSPVASARNLVFGLSRESSDRIASYLFDNSRSLKILASEYRGATREALQSLKQNVSNKLALNAVLLEQSLQVQNLDRLEKEISGLSSAYLSAEEEYAKLQSKFNRLALSPASLTTMWASVPLAEGVQVSAGDARYDANSNDVLLPDLAVRAFDLQAGEALNIQIEGEWGPSCALSRYSSDLDAMNILSGPNGYIVIQNQGKSRVESRENFSRFESSAGSSERVSVCGNTSVTSTSGLSSVSSSLTSSLCSENFLGTSASSGFSTSDRDENFLSSNLNLQGGITLPDTPFPKLPAGALIAVTSSAEGRNYQVLNRSSRIEVREASRVYLVVNDCKDQSLASSSNLTLDIYKMQLSDGLVRSELLVALESINKLYEEAIKILATGVDIDGELQLLAQKARAEIFAQTSTFSRFEVARQYLDHLLLFKTQQLMRKAKILDRSYRYAAESARFQSSFRDVQSNLTQNDLLILELKKIAEDLSVAYVGPKLNDSSNQLIEQILPVIFFQADQSDLEPFIVNSLSKLKASVRLEADLGEMTRNMADLMNDLGLALTQTNQFFRYRNQYDDVLIAVPHPELATSETLNQGTPALRGRSQLALWQALFGTAKQDLSQVVLQLAASEVYGDQFASGGISCNSRQPVIEDIAFALVTDQTDRSRDDLRSKSRNLDFPVRIGPGFVFPSPRGPLEFKVTNPNEGISNARYGIVRKDAYEDAYDFLRSPRDLSGAGKGLSPFGDWSFQADSLKAFVKANPELFYQNASKGALLVTDSLPGPAEQELKDFFVDDFGDFEVQPATGLEGAEIGSLEKFPLHITDILILIRFSSLTSTDSRLMSWIEPCR